MTGEEDVKAMGSKDDEEIMGAEMVGGGGGDEGNNARKENDDELFKRFAWSVKMDHRFPEIWDSALIPRLRQLPDLLPLFVRYFFWWIRTWLVRGIKPFIDMYTLNSKQIYGVPLGGIGSGTIGRGFKGEFCRFQMTPGIYTYDVVDADQFILSVRDPGGTNLYQKVLNGAGHPGTLSSWDWSFNPSDGIYFGLYPRSWYTYNIPEMNLILNCKQISPVIPHDYQDSCMPCGAFLWTLQNNSSEKKCVSLTFTFKNGTGSKSDKAGKCASQTFSVTRNSQRIRGVALEHQINGIQTTYGIGCLEKDDQTVTSMNQFDLKTGSDIWLKLAKSGKLDIESCSYELTKGEMGIAVNCQTMLEAGESKEMVFTLVWDQPSIKFKGKACSHTRRYTRFVGDSSSENKDEKPTTIAVQNLAAHCVSNYAKWNDSISKWQESVLKDSKLPSWFKSALFNETYFISDGGSVWVEYDKTILPRTVEDDDVRKDYGRFAYLEAHEYRMYNTYDVHFYASFALSMLFPKLQISLQYDMADAINFQDNTIRTHLFDGHRGPRKAVDTVPHDIGDPSEDPYLKLNSYLMHDISTWKDLNLKFVLQVFRDWKASNDKTYLKELLPICDKVMMKSLAWDVDGDGLIENSGSADQTYDTWIMTGTSAYCGSLWLAAVYSMTQMLNNSEIADKDEKVSLYNDILNRGKKSFHEKLWNGEYYNFDCSNQSHGKSIMSDQLCGHWFLAMCGVNDSEIFPTSNVMRALKTIYEKNVMSVRKGEMGAINGMNPDGTIDTYTIQSEETWTGVSYSVGATMIQAGMIEEGFKTGEGIYRTVYERIGLGFETPEALMQSKKKYRAIGYMRALGIWSMLLAWQNHSQQQS